MSSYFSVSICFIDYNFIFLTGSEYLLFKGSLFQDRVDVA